MPVKMCVFKSLVIKAASIKIGHLPACMNLSKKKKQENILWQLDLEKGL